MEIGSQQRQTAIQAFLDDSMPDDLRPQFEEISRSWNTVEAQHSKDLVIALGNVISGENMAEVTGDQVHQIKYTFVEAIIGIPHIEFVVGSNNKWQIQN